MKTKKIEIENGIPYPDRHYQTPIFELPFAEMGISQSFSIKYKDYLSAYKDRHGYNHSCLSGRYPKDPEQVLRDYMGNQKAKIRARNIDKWGNRRFAYRYIPESRELRCWRVI